MKQVFTDAFIRNLTKPGRYTDGQTKGLNLQVKKNGGKYWNYRFCHAGRRIDLSLGAYPDVNLKEARIRSIKARADLASTGLLPAIHRVDKTPEPQLQAPLFKDFAAECILSKSPEWRNTKHSAQWTSTIDQYANPILGEMTIDQIGTDDVLKVLKPIWNTKTETASRVRGRLEWILAVAITKGLRSPHNPAAWRGHLETILPRPKKIKSVRHHAALPYEHLPSLIEKLHDTDSPVALALEYLILNATRTSEVTGALREEITDNGLWIIPAGRMKANKEHRIPLGSRSLGIIETAEYLGKDSPYIFSVRGRNLSNMAMAMLLRRLGYPEVTVHGFRSTFRTWVAEETDHANEVAEMALAHTISNKVEAAYRRRDLLSRRRSLMADWEAFCLSRTNRDRDTQPKQKAA